MEIIELQLLARQLEGLGVALPDAAARALAVNAATMSAAAESPSADLRARLESGELTEENSGELLWAAAQRETARQSATMLARDLEHPTRRIVREAFAADADRIVAELRRPFDAAAAGVQRAAALFGPAVSVDQQLVEHADSLDRIRRARSAVDAITGGEPSPIVAGYITGRFG